MAEESLEGKVKMIQTGWAAIWLCPLHFSAVVILLRLLRDPNLFTTYFKERIVRV